MPDHLDVAAGAKELVASRAHETVQVEVRFADTTMALSALNDLFASTALGLELQTAMRLA